MYESHRKQGKVPEQEHLQEKQLIAYAEIAVLQILLSSELQLK